MAKRFQVNITGPAGYSVEELKLDSKTGEQPNSIYDEWIHVMDIIKNTAIEKRLIPQELLNIWYLTLTQINKGPI